MLYDAIGAVENEFEITFGVRTRDGWEKKNIYKNQIITSRTRNIRVSCNDMHTHTHIRMPMSVAIIILLSYGRAVF